MTTPERADDAVAGEVRAALARARLTQTALAEQLGWNQPYLNRRLLGEVSFSVPDLAAIARALGVPVSAFTGILDEATG